MACSCSGNNRCNGGYGCRRAVAGARWPSCGCDGCSSNGGTCTGESVAATSCAQTGGYGTGCGCNGCPFYNGPCGPTETVCGCTGNCPPGSVPEPYGFFTQTGTLSIDAGANTPFSGERRANGVSINGGQITLARSGVYLITLNVTVPANTALDTSFSIRLNGETTPGGTLTVNVSDVSSPTHAVRQVVVSACAGAVLTVETSQAIDLTASSTSDPIAVLTVAKIS